MRETFERHRGAFVWAYCLAVFGAGVVLASWVLSVEPPASQPFRLPWWVLALAFAATERFVVDLDVRKQAQTLAFTEAPLVLGLMLGSPKELVVVRVLVGVGAIVIFRRSAVVKVVFNAGLFAVQTSVAVAVFKAVLADGTPVDPRGWMAGALAAGAFFATSGILVVGVMALVGSEATVRSQALVLAIGFAAALAGAFAALASASALWDNARSWVLLAPICAALGFFGLAYIKLRERHQSLALLNAYAGRLVADAGEDELVESVLTGIGELLNASRVAVALRHGPYAVFHTLDSSGFARAEHDATEAEFSLAAGLAQERGVGWPAGATVLGMALETDNVIVKPLLLGDSIGLVVVDGRVSAARDFDDEDVQLLETAAGHAASALRNVQLVERLREEAAFRARQALHDEITDLPNGRALVEKLKEDLAGGVRLIALTLRVHSLREVNETLGRPMGDEMLRQVAQRLVSVHPDSWCARSGTDEFTVVVAGGQDDAEVVAHRLVEAFDQPVQCNEVSLAVTVGIGVALAPQHGTEAEILVRRASLAASRSALDGTTVTTWAADRDPYDPQRLTIAADLRDAIPRGELELQFQPQVDMKTGDIVGAEALVRWAHPRLGHLRPDQFISAAEHTGAIDALTFHVLTVAAQTGRRWHDRGWDLEMAVNLSARNLTSPRFAANVADILERTGFPASMLTLELTESSVMTEAGRALATLDELSELGVTISIDDFGTGYSSLAHLRRLPVNEIKIDKSFVFDLTTSESDEAIVRSMVELGHNLSLRVVVEGVETVEVRDRLEKIGSDRLQGYLVSRPLPAGAFEHWMQERRVRGAEDVAGRVVHLQPRR